MSGELPPWHWRNRYPNASKSTDPAQSSSVSFGSANTVVDSRSETVGSVSFGSTIPQSEFEITDPVSVAIKDLLADLAGAGDPRAHLRWREHERRFDTACESGDDTAALEILEEWRAAMKRYYETTSRR